MLDPYLTHDDAFRLHAIIAGNVMDQGEAGRYRTIRVRVGAFVPPPPEDVSGLTFVRRQVEDLTSWLEYCAEGFQQTLQRVWERMGKLSVR